MNPVIIEMVNKQSRMIKSAMAEMLSLSQSPEKQKEPPVNKHNTVSYNGIVRKKKKGRS